jgi:hypothetical protein
MRSNMGRDNQDGLMSNMKNPKQPRPPKLTDTERHMRFVETAKKVGASEDSKDFDRAFDTVVTTPSPGLRKVHGSNVRK